MKIGNHVNAAQTLPSGRVALGQQSPALALGPLDGRYRPQTAPLVDHLSEAALNRERVHVEVEWFIHLCQQRALAGLEPLTAEQEAGLRAVVTASTPPPWRNSRSSRP
ncbi:hypothetical protein QJS66_17515 [Kocuria rhizophila]|nr:hypothetical protein QJS66_17515 [Kocuria rhizophila]